MINPEILLQGKNPQIQTSLDAQTQAAQVRNLGNVGQLQQGEIAMQPGQLEYQRLQNQSQTLQNNAAQLAATDQVGLRKAYIDANGDVAQTRANAIKNGVSMGGIQGLDAQVTARQTLLSKLKADDLDNHQKQTDGMHSLFSPVAGIADPIAQKAAWDQASDDSVKAGYMTADEAKLHPYLGPQNAALRIAQLTGDKAMTAEAAAKTAQSKVDAAANAKIKTDQVLVANAYTGVKSADDLAAQNTRLVAQGVPENQLLSAYDPVAVQRIGESTLSAENRATNANAAKERDQAAANQRNTQAYQANEIALRNREIGIQQQHLDVAKKAAANGDDPLAARSPADIVRLTAIANGTAPALNARSKDYKADMDAVYAIDPSYKESRYLGNKAFATGKDADQLVTMTTALAHLDRAKTNSTALGTSALESLGWNLTPAQHKYAADTDLLSGEIGKLVKGGAVTVDESKRLIGNLHSGLQENRDSALDELSQLMNGKIEGISQKYFNATGRAVPRGMFSPETQRLMGKYNVGAASDAAAPGGAPGGAPAPAAAPAAPVAAAPAGIVVNTPAGPVTFKNQSIADAYKKKMGLK